MEWMKRWGYEMSPKAVRPGIWRLRTGGYYVFLRVRDPRGTRKLTMTKALHNATVQEAQRWRDNARGDAQEHLAGRGKRKQLFSSFAASLFKEKVDTGDIKSAKGREKWATALTHHILPEFGDIYCGELTTEDFARWRRALAVRVKASVQVPRGTKRPKGSAHLSPTTVNTWFSVVRVICSAMTTRLKLSQNPADGLKNLDTSQHETYTEEAPNTLSASRAAAFLQEMKESYPQFYAMTILGFITGKRPSTLRPLRRSGAQSDVDWNRGLIRFRRSNSMKQEVMIGTKTGKKETVHLPPEVMEVLRQHVQGLTRPKQRDSEYLFPSYRGEMRARSVLDIPFQKVSKAIGLNFTLTPGIGMRRTFNDVAREAAVHDVVVRSISGHTTEKMQIHYSTAQAKEQRQAISAIGRLVGSPERAVKRAVKGKAR